MHGWHWNVQEVTLPTIAAAGFGLLLVGAMVRIAFLSRAESQLAKHEASSKNLKALVSGALKAALPAHGDKALIDGRTAYDKITEWLGPVHAFTKTFNERYEALENAVSGLDAAGPKPGGAAILVTLDPLKVTTVDAATSPSAERELTPSEKIDAVRKALADLADFWDAAPDVEGKIKRAQHALNNAPKPPPKPASAGGHDH